MTQQETVVLNRDCEGQLIPSGVPVRLKSGTEGFITQALGGTYTVYIHGNLVRIAGSDAEAIGKTVEPSALEKLDYKASIQDKVDVQLKSCYDPEIPINIVDLGLVYHTSIVPKDQSYEVYIEMTLTAPGCGMGPALTLDVKQKLLAIPKVKSVEVRLVFDPPWDKSRISESARLGLGLI